MAYLSEEQIEEATRKLRIRLGIDQQTIPDMMTVIVKLKGLGIIKDYRRVADNDMLEDLATFDPDPKVLLIRESTFCAMNRNEPRARFTIAHELGHMWLGHKRTRHRNVSGREIEKIAPTIRRDEYQASRFAGAFLAPAHLANGHMTANQLAQRFILSSKSAEIRKGELERLHRREHGVVRPLPEEFAEFLRALGKKEGRNLPSLDIDDARKRSEARAKGYEEQPCSKCGKFTLVRNDTCFKCDTCGSTTGCS
jgi:Zn-dependent peptidase ImmA (M78 family)